MIASFLAVALLWSQGPSVQGSRAGSTSVPPVTGLPKNQRTYALFIGINAYEKFKPLKFAEADAQELRDVLVEKYGFSASPQETRLLLGKAATRKAILENLGWLKETATSEDRIFLFFAGHGATVGEGDQRQGYIVPSSAAFDPVPPRQADFDADAISMNLVWNNYLGRKEVCKARHVLIVADACFSGAFVRERGNAWVDQGLMNKFAKGEGREVMTAADRFGTSLEDDLLRHGRFTHALIQSLSERHSLAKYSFTAANLFDAAQARVSMESDSDQVPRYDPNGYDGRFIFSPDGTYIPIDPSTAQSVKLQVALLAKELTALNFTTSKKVGSEVEELQFEYSAKVGGRATEVELQTIETITRKNESGASVSKQVRTVRDTFDVLSLGINESDLEVQSIGRAGGSGPRYWQIAWATYRKSKSVHRFDDGFPERDRDLDAWYWGARSKEACMRVVSMIKGIQESARLALGG